jgi:transcriptional adapter 3
MGPKRRKATGARKPVLRVAGSKLQSVATGTSNQIANTNDTVQHATSRKTVTDLELETKPTSSPSRSTAERNHTRKFSGDGDSASSSLSPVQQTTPPATGVTDIKIAGSEIADDDDSSDEHQPPPAPAVPHLLTFGDDPWEFPDPTVYEIRDVKPGMPDDEIKQIYSVADYPHDDLHDLIPGTPPDKDFSSAKPSNQVQATTFAAYADQYMRPFTEEDLAFLRDRGDRTGPFLMPRRGKKHYTEVWAEEDGAMSIDNPRQGREKLPANQARGSVEDLDDDIAETDEISVGPLSSRLLSLMRPEHRAPPAEIPH